MRFGKEPATNLDAAVTDALSSTAAPLLPELPGHNLSDADLHQRGGLHHRHFGAPQ